ncbi:TIGR01457 family HAD-type hydrolase [Paenibacillus sp. GCM10012307]|uniref:TIGR01457 family HAD-type hydrolase n=1 Tax=Paenibacillus roseus TaxID=2798579 RepID=A0A934MQY3_9BACL|nr:TIGR01457 family HAD-type hydrolase [Paenibacillus roseus]MBJ6363656.1 TIGR01457 family HAD-type hydrolase [Paenibacillus roseus]
MSVQKLSAPKGLLIDLDGTLYHGERKIDGADEWIVSLREAGLPYLFVTNNSTAAPEIVANRLSRMGIPAAAEDVVTSAQAAAAYIARIRPGASVHILGETGLRQAAACAGLRLEPEGRPDFVLQGIDRELTYEKLKRTVALLLEGAEYILTNPDVLLPSDDGLLPGAGSLSALLQTASGVKPTIIGKPSNILVEFALDRMGLKAGDTWMVGDNMATDIAAGKSAGCGTALVLTGLTNTGNLDHYREQTGIEPDGIFADLRELNTYILSLLGI